MSVGRYLAAVDSDVAAIGIGTIIQSNNASPVVVTARGRHLAAADGDVAVVSKDADMSVGRYLAAVDSDVAAIGIDAVNRSVHTELAFIAARALGVDADGVAAG